MIKLPGLMARHPGAALASFGFYNFFDGFSEISWYVNRRDYSPEIHTSEVETVDDLVELLANRERWERLLWKEKYVKFDISLDQYKKIIEQDSKWSILGSDHIINDKKINDKEIKVISSTPFRMFIRNTFWEGVRAIWLDALSKKNIKSQIKQTLTGVWNNDCYVKDGHQNGLLYKSDPRASQSRSDYGTMPIICLLSCLGYLLFPCYCVGKKSVALGWQNSKGDSCFYYPIFTQPINKETFISWMSNLRLLKKMPHQSKTLVGLGGVYKSPIYSYKTGNYSSRTFGAAIPI